MNKTFNINLGGMPFTIDDNAFTVLDNYLDQLNRYFAKSDSNKEILQDIEFRIAEIFKEKQKTSSIINLTMVEDTIKLMGTPTDLGDHTENSNQSKNINSNMPNRKKLFRDLEDKKVAGVCSGLAHYFNVDDPIWIRAIFLFALLAGGSGFLAYLVLWVLVPPARTASDRLQMQGEPINIDNIAQKVEEKFEHLTEKFESIIQKTYQKSK